MSSTSSSTNGNSANGSISRADLSNGLEANKLPLINQFDQKVCPDFVYIVENELEPEMVAHFQENKEQECPKLVSAEAAIKSNETSFQVFNSGPKKGWALRALKPIGAADQFLFEYVGQLKFATPEIDQNVQNDDYIFGFNMNDTSYMIDASTTGNLARFCNHSCEPNCRSKLATLDDSRVPHVLIYSARPIVEGEELTLDYGEGWWKAKSELSCACNSGLCIYLGIPGGDVRMKKTVAVKCAGAGIKRKAEVGNGNGQMALMAPNEPNQEEEEEEDSDDEDEENEEEEDEENDWDMPRYANGRIKQTARKACGGFAPRISKIKQTASKAVGGYAPGRMKMTARKDVAGSFGGPRPKMTARKAVGYGGNGPMCKVARKMTASKAVSCVANGEDEEEDEDTDEEDEDEQETEIDDEEEEDEEEDQEDEDEDEPEGPGPRMRQMDTKDVC